MPLKSEREEGRRENLCWTMAKPAIFGTFRSFPSLSSSFSFLWDKKWIRKYIYTFHSLPFFGNQFSNFYPIFLKKIIFVFYYNFEFIHNRIQVEAASLENPINFTPRKSEPTIF